MKKVFKIYPSLFVLSCNKQNEQAVDSSRLQKTKFNCDLKDICILKGRPQRYRGNRVNADGTTVSIRFTCEMVSYSSVMNIPESLFTTLEPTTFVGKNYTLTYLSVHN